MPLTVGGGVRAVEDIRTPAAGRRRQGLDQHRRRGTAGFVREARREIRRPVHRRRHRRHAGARPANGRSSPTAAARARASTPSTRRAAWPSAAPARSCSPPWTATAPSRATTSHSTRAVADAVPVPVIASGGAGTLEHLVEGVTAGRRDGGARRLDLPFRRPSPSPRRRNIWRVPVFPFDKSQRSRRIERRVQ